jgi:hypothetical protein
MTDQKETFQMRTINRTALALLAALASAPIAHSAFAQGAALYPRTLSSGEDTVVDYGPGPLANQFGGGLSRVIGSGESASVEYLGTTRLPDQEPRFAHVVGTGTDATIVHSRSADRGTALAEAGITPPANNGSFSLAWLFGGRRG